MSNNPYVVLRVEWGTAPDEAQIAFARRARGLRRAPGGVEMLQELTRALNEIDEIAKDPRRAVGVFRIPSDPSAFIPPGLGALRPPPEKMGRHSAESSAELVAFTDAAVEQCVHVRAAGAAANAALPAR